MVEGGRGRFQPFHPNTTTHHNSCAQNLHHFQQFHHPSGLSLYPIFMDLYTRFFCAVLGAIIIESSTMAAAAAASAVLAAAFSTRLLCLCRVGPGLFSFQCLRVKASRRFTTPPSEVSSSAPLSIFVIHRLREWESFFSLVMGTSCLRV
jgi:hypothetical protein